MPGQIISLNEFKDYLGLKKESEGDALIEIFRAAGEQMIRDECEYDFDQRPYTGELHSGAGKTHIFTRQRPVAVSPLPTVTEDGVSMTVAAGYSSTAHVVFDPVEGIFTRQPIALQASSVTLGKRATWADGNNNIVLGYTGGYAAADMPKDLKALTLFAAAFLRKAQDRNEITVKQRSNQQGSTEFYENLPGFYRAILERYRRSPYAA